jgi:hypothetical protein
MGLVSTSALGFVLLCCVLNISALNRLVSKKPYSRLKLFAASTTAKTDGMSLLYEDMQNVLPSKEPSEIEELKSLIAAGTSIETFVLNLILFYFINSYY